MENRNEQTGKTGSTSQASQADISKAQAPQRPIDPEGANPQPKPDQTDIEGGPATDTGFVGAEGGLDTSSELIEDGEPDFAKDGQGSVE